ncbi:hypothetical protein M514_27948 [Trichuris suis]|uniref:Uncharacterized protein n=1 Tax=Trichuris suis TaxID=68888 RepID=A0A085MRM1_9BILA|nr:hypothetical protein M514_27948 [Trichuris suis]
MLKFQAAVWNASIAPLRVHVEEAVGSYRRRVRCHPRGHPTVAPAQTGCVAYVHPSAAVNEFQRAKPSSIILLEQFDSFNIGQFAIKEERSESMSVPTLNNAYTKEEEKSTHCMENHKRKTQEEQEERKSEKRKKKKGKRGQKKAGTKDTRNTETKKAKQNYKLNDNLEKKESFKEKVL